MSPLNTSDPLALQVLMSETIFDIDFPAPLIEEASPEILPIQKEIEIVLKTYGGNNKNILFVISDNNNEFLSPDAEIAFMKILRALKLSLEDIIVLNYSESHNDLAYEKIKEKMNPKKCIFLGADPQLLGIEACAENIINLKDEIQMLYTYSFDEMLNDTEKKRLFWDAIKLMDL